MSDDQLRHYLSLRIALVGAYDEYKAKKKAILTTFGVDDLWLKMRETEFAEIADGITLDGYEFKRSKKIIFVVPQSEASFKEEDVLTCYRINGKTTTKG